MKFKTLRNAAFAALVLLLPSLAGAQTGTFFKAYDIDATSYTYGVFLPWAPGYCTIETSGSSTTTTATSGCGNVFDPVGVGDEISVVISGVVTKRIVTAKASGASITVASAWDITARDWQRRDFQSGTTTTDGWFNTNALAAVDVHLVVSTLVSDAITFSVECRGDGDATASKQVFTDSFTSATFPDNGTVVVVGEICSAMRVGVKVGTDAGTDSISAFIVAR